MRIKIPTNDQTDIDIMTACDHITYNDVADKINSYVIRELDQGLWKITPLQFGLG